MFEFKGALFLLWLWQWPWRPNLFDYDPSRDDDTGGRNGRIKPEKERKEGATKKHNAGPALSCLSRHGHEAL